MEAGTRPADAPGSAMLLTSPGAGASLMAAARQCVRLEHKWLRKMAFGAGEAEKR